VDEPVIALGRLRRQRVVRQAVDERGGDDFRDAGLVVRSCVSVLG
jgi:hypothetical protein